MAVTSYVSMLRGKRQLAGLLVAVVSAATLAFIPFATPGLAAPLEPSACPASAPDEAAAGRAAKDCSGRVEVVSARGEKTQVFANANGSFTRVEAAVVQRVRGVDGRGRSPTRRCGGQLTGATCP